MRTDQLILSHFSLGKATFEQRVAAAAAGGFSGIGLWSREYERLVADGTTPGDLRATADACGVRVAEIEVLDGWEVAPLTPQQSAKEQTMFEMADVFGARHLHAMGPVGAGIDQAAEAFAGLCDRAAEHDLLVAIEAMPFTAITDLGVALAIASAAARPNGGLCIDAWHHFRGANDRALLRSVPAAMLVSVQLDDGPTVPGVDDYLVDTISNRRPPGEGEFDLCSFVADLAAKDTQVPVSVEVLSSALNALAPDVVARRLGDATRRVLDRG